MCTTLDYSVLFHKSYPQSAHSVASAENRRDNFEDIEAMMHCRSNQDDPMIPIMYKV